MNNPVQEKLLLLNGYTFANNSLNRQILCELFLKCLNANKLLTLLFNCMICLKRSKAFYDKIKFLDGFIPICLKCLRVEE